MTKREEMYARIIEHGNKLQEIFRTDMDSVALCKKLRRLENKAHGFALAWCNGELTSDEIDLKTVLIESAFADLFGYEYADLLIINYDARGYALKIDDAFVPNHIRIHRDFGGNPILAPDFT